MWKIKRQQKPEINNFSPGEDTTKVWRPACQIAGALDRAWDDGHLLHDGLYSWADHIWNASQYLQESRHPRKWWGKWFWPAGQVVVVRLRPDSERFWVLWLCIGVSLHYNSELIQACPWANVAHIADHIHTRMLQLHQLELSSGCSSRNTIWWWRMQTLFKWQVEQQWRCISKKI